MQYEIYNISHNQEHKIAEVADIKLAQRFLTRVVPKFTFKRYEARQKTEASMLKDIQRALNDYKVILEHADDAKEEMQLCDDLLRLLDARVINNIASGLDAAINRLRDSQ